MKINGWELETDWAEPLTDDEITLLGFKPVEGMTSEQTADELSRCHKYARDFANRKKKPKKKPKKTINVEAASKTNVEPTLPAALEEYLRQVWSKLTKQKLIDDLADVHFCRTKPYCYKKEKGGMRNE